MKRLHYLLFILILIAPFLRAQEQERLKTTDIHRIMQQILNQHVDKKRLTRKILQAALVNYIDQFDSHHVYLLEAEVAPFLDLSDEQLDEILEQYEKNNFEIFQQLDQTIKRSIERSRMLRQKIEEENIDENIELNIENIIKKDIKLLKLVGWFIEKVYKDGKRLKPKEIVNEFDLPPSCTSASFTIKNHY